MPKKPFDWETFDKLCALPPVISREEIADIMRVSHDTMERRIKEEHDMTYASYRKKKQSKLRSALVSKQFQVAMSGNTTMLIWLGKNYLGQSDHADVDSGDGKIVSINYVQKDSKEKLNAKKPAS